VRLKRSDCSSDGITRRRSGRGFVYVDASGARIRDDVLIARIKDLAIPPAWQEVWICPDVNGHIQATGIDDAGRKQYLYHERWTSRRSAEKFDSMLRFAAALPRLRRAASRDLELSEPVRSRVLAGAVRLIDLGHFRVGGEQYAEENSTFGVATILKSQVRLTDDTDGIEFTYPAKGSQERNLTIHDRQVRRLSEELVRRRSGPEDFLVYREGRRWIDVRSEDVNEYIQEHAGEEFSAKDFRTWHGTVTAAVHLASDAPPRIASAREKDQTGDRCRRRRTRQHPCGRKGLLRGFEDPRSVPIRRGDRAGLEARTKGQDRSLIGRTIGSADAWRLI